MSKREKTTTIRLWSPIGLLISYMLACPLTDRISLDLTQTHWTDLMTYVIWLFAGFIWLVIVLLVVGVIAAVASR